MFRTLLAACLFLISYLTYSSTLLMREKRSSETSVDFYQIALRYILEESTPHRI